MTRIWIPGYICRRKGKDVVIKGHYREMTENEETRSRAATEGWRELKKRMKS